LIGALLGFPFLISRGDGSPSLNIVAFLSCWIFEWKVEWNTEYFPKKTKSTSSPKADPKKRRHFVKRCLIFGLGALLFGAVITSVLYQNLQVEINGERVKIKDVLANFFKSQEYLQLCQQLSSVLKQLWAFYLEYGFKGIWAQIWTALDYESDKQAFEVTIAQHHKTIDQASILFISGP
jgi:hypothetical protein